MLEMAATTETHLKLEKLANNYVWEDPEKCPNVAWPCAHVTFSQTKRKLLIFRKRFEQRKRRKGRRFFLTRTFHF